jgi:hypothetical protein
MEKIRGGTMNKNTIDLLWSVRFDLQGALEKALRLPDENELKRVVHCVEIALGLTDQQIHCAKRQEEIQKLLNFGEEVV